MIWTLIAGAVLVMLSLSETALEESPQSAIFTPGEIVLDTDGKELHAHGGGVLQQNGTFFWYGTTQKYPPSWISEGINLYSSQDLQNWQFEGEIFKDSQIQGVGLQHPYRIERPKILFDARTASYTMLFHLDTPSFALSSVGVAKAGDIRGPWTWEGGYKPDGLDSYDMTAWQDEDGTAYFARSVQNSYLGISELDSNLSKTLGICASASQAEAPAIFKPWKGQYFIIASHLTGWAANSPQMFSSQGNSLCEGRLHPVASPAYGPGAETTFNSQIDSHVPHRYNQDLRKGSLIAECELQPTYVFPLSLGDNITLFIYMGDRWNFYGKGSVGHASYVWLPLLPSKSSSFELIFREKWSPKEFKKALQDTMAASYIDGIKTS